MIPDELRAQLATLIEWRNAAQAEVVELSERSGDLEGDDATRWGELVDLFDECERQIPELEQKLAQVERIMTADERAMVPQPDVQSRRLPIPGIVDPFESGREHGAPGDVRDSARRVIEAVEMPGEKHDAALRESAEAALRYDDSVGSIARRIVITGRPAYRSAFSKFMQMRGDELDDNERAAVASMRAMSLTDAAGGYAIPFLIDDSVVLTGDHDGLVSSIRSISNVVRGTSDVWNGVSSAGVTAEWLAEGAEAADASPTLAQPSITAHKGSAFVPFSVELGGGPSGDWAGLETELRRLFAVAKADLEEEAFTTGSGTGQPKGIVTALSGSYEESSATSDVFAGADLYTLHDALAPRFRSRASWLANIVVISAIRKFDADGGTDYAIQPGLTAGMPPTLLGRPVVEAPYMSAAITTDAADILIFGDMSGYYIYERIGQSVELVPHVFGSQGRPTGERGLWMWFRVGADLVNTSSCRLLTLS